MKKLVFPLSPGEIIINEQPGPGGTAACRGSELRAEVTCPVCGRARLDYNGLLELACPSCGFSQGGGFT